MYDDVLLNKSNNSTENLKSKSPTNTNFETLFNNINKDIVNVNNIISDLKSKRKANAEEEHELLEERDKLNQEKVNFENYIHQQKLELEQAQKRFDDYVKTQKQYLNSANEEFKVKMDHSLQELDILKKELEMNKEKFKEQQEQFETYKNIELKRLQQTENILNSEKTQFEKYKEISNRRLELETKDLEYKISKFKNVVGQFSVNFKPIINNKE